MRAPDDPPSRSVSIGAPPGGMGVRPVTRGAPVFSIRAPARGRCVSPGSDQAPTAFQSAPPRGGDHRTSMIAGTVALFQSAPPRGGDVDIVECPTVVHMFQSAPPRGGDARFASSIVVAFLFQSAPPRGGDPSTTRASPMPRFQSAPPRGGDLRGAGPARLPPSVSIRAPARGRCRDGRPPPLLPAPAHVSIRAPARGRFDRSGWLGAKTRFQSAPPRGGDGATLTNGRISAIPAVRANRPDSGVRRPAGWRARS